MAPQQHLVLSWVLSNLNYDKRRDRIVATLCGVIPDIDGLGVIIDKITGDGAYYYYFAWHHKSGHNLLGVIVIGLIAYFICGKKILLKSRCNYVIIELELYRLSQKKCENVRKCCL
jgi:hypothetical protein